jgi:hypothetical protein
VAGKKVELFVQTACVGPQTGLSVKYMQKQQDICYFESDGACGKPILGVGTPLAIS